jgi:integrase/recombinase XerD
MTTSLTKYTNKENMIVQSSWDMLSENSKKSYQSDLNVFFDFVKKDLTKIDQADIINYVLFLQKQGYKNATINRKISSVSKMFSVYQVVGAIKVNPVDLARKSGRLNFKVVRSNRSQLTLQNIKDCLSAKHTTRSDHDVAIMIRFLAKTGLRISELIGIELKDIQQIDKKTMKIRIVGKGKKERFVTIEKKFIDEIIKHFKHDKLLFCSPGREKYNRSWVWQVLKDRFKNTVGVKVSPHSLRHFYATYKIVTQGKDVKAVSSWLGHSSTSITLDMYVDSALSIDDGKVEI